MRTGPIAKSRKVRHGDEIPGLGSRRTSIDHGHHHQGHEPEFRCQAKRHKIHAKGLSGMTRAFPNARCVKSRPVASNGGSGRSALWHSSNVWEDHAEGREFSDTRSWMSAILCIVGQRHDLKLEWNT